MALTATILRFDIQLSDVDRGVYEALSLRVAQHPSETLSYLLTRVIAYALCYEEGIGFSRGLSASDEPAIWVKDLQGQTQAIVEIGTPSAERLHRATKAVPRVTVFTHHGIAALQRVLHGKQVHRLSEVHAYALDPVFIEALQGVTSRSNTWDLSRNDGELYLAVEGQTLTTRPELHPLG